jgi:hypothetical protein
MRRQVSMYFYIEDKLWVNPERMIAILDEEPKSPWVKPRDDDVHELSKDLGSLETAETPSW